MWHSLEVRVPFLDHTLVEFAATIPSRYKLHRWQKKYVLIEALRGLVPDIVLTRRKQGFSIPLANWLRGPLREFVRDHLSETSLKDAGLFNTRVVARLLDEHDRFVRNHETKIWVLLTIMIWIDIYMRRRSGKT
jgi:asparagine synthase (glutamine-hydrolysing)